jgi:iron complex outermembrane receptor protein
LIGKYFTVFIGLSIALFANDIDNILMDMEVQNDLSEKTKKENNGIVYVYTRSDLNTMGITHLRDILKSSVIGFKISRYGLIDPNTSGLSPFASSNIRFYIDNQEISSTLYGSGLVTGDLELSFVDHIEIYTYNPSFESASEPTAAMIKLYTKTYERDPGVSIRAGYGSYNSNAFSATKTDKLGDYKYMVHVSQDVDNKEKNNLGGAHDLSRDNTKTHSLITVYNDKRQFLFTSVKNRTDSFLGANWNGDPSQSNIDINMLHLGYEESFFNNISFALTYDSLKDQSQFGNDSNITSFMYHFPSSGLPGDWAPVSIFNVNDKSSVVTTKLQQKLNIGHHDILYGAKYRTKDLDYTLLEIAFLGGDMTNVQYKGITKQNVLNTFVEDNYNISDNSIFTLGYQHSIINNNNNDDIKDDQLNLFRVGNTYLNENFTIQTFFHYQETAIEPYLVNSIYLVDDGIKKQKIQAFIEKIKYVNQKNIYDVTYTHERIKDYMGINDLGLILNIDDDVIKNTFLVRWTHNYTDVNKIFVSYYLDATDSTNRYVDGVTHKLVVQNSNRYDTWNFFEQLVVDRTKDDLYYDLNLGISYAYGDNLNLYLNGENLFNHALEQRFIHNNTSASMIETYPDSAAPFLISPIDQKIMLTLEYTF